MRHPPTKLAVIQATEAFCLKNGVDALSFSAVARTIDASVADISALFRDEVSLLDAVLDRHQSPYEREWERVFSTIDSPRGAMHLLVKTIAGLIYDEDGGPAYVAVCAQMCTSARFTLTGRPATTTPTALKLIGKLNASSLVPFALMPTRFERFALVLFSSVYAWYRHGSARLAEPAFVEDLVDCLESVSSGVPSADTLHALEAAG